MHCTPSCICFYCSVSFHTLLILLSVLFSDFVNSPNNSSLLIFTTSIFHHFLLYSLLFTQLQTFSQTASITFYSFFHIIIFILLLLFYLFLYYNSLFLVFQLQSWISFSHFHTLKNNNSSKNVFFLSLFFTSFISVVLNISSFKFVWV